MTKGDRKDSPEDTRDHTSVTGPPRPPKFNTTSGTPTRASSKNQGAANSSKESATNPAGSCWKDKEEWLYRVPADVKKARHQKDQWARCGKSSHKWFQCTNRIIISAGGGKKRKVEGSWRHGEGGP